MKLLTKAIIKKLPEIGATEQVPLDDKEIIVKFFDPCGSTTWYAVEGQQMMSGDFEFFGLVDGDFKEWGYFYLSELQEYKGPLNLGIERDLHFSGIIGDIK